MSENKIKPSSIADSERVGVFLNVFFLHAD